MSFLKNLGLVTEDSPKPEPKKTEAPVQVKPTVFGQTGERLYVPTNYSAGIINHTPDPKFTKFFEDELEKSNFPGPDYYEYKQLFAKTKSKLSAKGVTDEEVILQAVLAALSAQDVTTEQLVVSANRYKELLNTKANEQINQAEQEKLKLLKQRDAASQQDKSSISSIVQKLAQLEQERVRLNDELGRLNAKLQVNSTIGQEQISKLDSYQQQMTAARNSTLDGIDNDIQTLQNSH